MNSRYKLYVTKRDGKIMPVRFDEITDRITQLCDLNDPLDMSINPFEITQTIISNIKNKILTSEIDDLAANMCATNLNHPDYIKLASRIIITSHHKNVTYNPGIKFSEVANALYNNIVDGKKCPIINEDLYNISKDGKYDDIIDMNRDFLIDFFGYKTLLNSYLLKVNKSYVVETPQHMYLRVAVALHSTNYEKVKETYDLLSLQYFTHASPTLFNAGTPRSQLSSCFLFGMEDSIDGIYKTISDSAKISKHAGGIGLSISDIRAIGSYIKGTDGISSGIGPMLRVLNDTARYVNQCFTPDTYIYTKNGPVFIKDIKKGMEVITIDGTYKKVNEVIINNFSGNLRKIKLEKSSNVVRCTDVHEIYANNSFIPAKEVGVGDFLFFPKIDRKSKYLEKIENFKDIENIDLLKYSDSIIIDYIYSNIISEKYEYVKETDMVNIHNKTREEFNIVKCLLLRLNLYCFDENYKISFKSSDFLTLVDTYDKEVNFEGFYTKVEYNVEEFYSGPVYDLNIEENHNYLTEIGIVHNSGKRLGSFATYIEPWHADIFTFLECKLQRGTDDETRAKDLFYGLWIPDLFMKRLLETNESGESVGEWSLMCPNECKGLTDCYGDKFEELYTKYEKEGKYRKKIKALDLWTAIINSQIETGTPYMLYKDSCNIKSNHKNLGTIKNSNLCTEIIEYSDKDKYACCVLASIVLQTFVESKEFNYTKLYEVTRVITRNLDKIIDINYYPVPETKKSNMSERPLGIGVQGLADVFFKLKIPFDCEKAFDLNRKIFETIYYAALTESCELAKEYGKYDSYEGSPVSQGILQIDMWPDVKLSGLWDWDLLRNNIKQYGVRNSLLTALMPTASTAQIVGSVEAFEPITSNIYTRRVLAGEFVVFNKYLSEDLIKNGLWNKQFKNKLIENKGSVQNTDIPQELKDIYKNVWEIKQKVLIDMSADRSPFIDQSQSLNLFFEKPRYDLLSNAHIYGFKRGLKTGSYYIRSKPSSSAESFTVDKEECEMCSS